MSDDATPAKVRLTDGLGAWPLTDPHVARLMARGGQRLSGGLAQHIKRELQDYAMACVATATDAAKTERLLRELEAHRIYARLLCKAVDAATDFAGTVAGGASWWDDVWADHVAELEKARDAITAVHGPNVN
jgi:hypothetical protein